MMANLTRDEKTRLGAQLLAALHPDQRPRLRDLSAAAFTAAMRDYYGDKALKMLAATPAEWWSTVQNGHPVDFAAVHPTGEPFSRNVHGPVMRVPRSPPSKHPYGAAAQAAIDTWARAVDEDNEARATTTHHITTVLARANTLEALLRLLPAARDILKLPPAEDPAASAARLDAELARRATKADKPAPPPASNPPAAKPAASKPARKRTA
jgi:hypothetical protein